MTARIIAQQDEKIRAQAAQIDRQAELVKALRIKLAKAERAVEEAKRRLEIAKGAKG